MTPKELTNSILQYAIQGKLVEQRTCEGTADDLYKAIIADKKYCLMVKKKASCLVKLLRKMNFHLTFQIHGNGLDLVIS